MASPALLISKHPAQLTIQHDVEYGSHIALEATDLTLAFETEGEPVLSNINVTLHEGETVLLLGPSGCGKSSLAFCLTGLYPHAIDSLVEGSVLLYGKPIEQYDSGEAAQHIGIVFQDFESQFCMLRVEEEIAFCLENRDYPRTEMESMIQEVLEKVGLLAWRHAYIHELSGGMKQKLALACALALCVHVLVLDEPTSNLDPYTRHQFAALIAEMARKEGMALLIIEHQLDDWIGMANRLLVMDEDGALVFDGLPASYFKHHAAEAKSRGIWLPQALELQQFIREWFNRSNSSDGNNDDDSINIFDFSNYDEQSVHQHLESAEPALTDEDLLNLLLSLPKFAQQDVMRILTSAQSNGSPRKPEEVLQAHNLVYRRKGRVILDHVSLTLHSGEWVALVGPNGAGKSTLASLLSGLTQPEEGQILLNGMPLHRYAERELRAFIGYVFQNPEHQFITDTVFDELAFGMRLQLLSEEEVQQHVGEALTRFRLNKVANANPFSISQGQKRRLSVASVLTDSQQLLLCDEPTYGQDAYTSKQLMDTLQARTQAGATVLMITHDMEWVQSYADRIIVLDEGSIRYDGSPTKLWREHPELMKKCHLRMPMNFAVASRLLAQTPGIEGGDHPDTP
ncbi:ABC transporter ATP-binding protein [Paenibacillus popilliae]|uniref:Energy-coupling factor ABC transporter ATP-binding protein n=1 Tax=Paenibacillus popilliae TaxID=78057 RepID=A0ABY3ASD0_PAEPP|nr:ABC transporter ATP-binding protein [Paenibacillus sp. SDF0028]TQR45146.1 energy-coupling factor ABC transporter ATP-binding protein [Paenibacillus sp. SDF0028]